MKLYIATCFGNREAAARFADDAVAAGHEITHDWMRVEGNAKDDELTDEQCVHHGNLDLDGAEKADVVVFLAEPGDFCGALIEFGYVLFPIRRLGSNTEIWVISPWRFSIFWRQKNVYVFEEEDARARLNMVPAEGLAA